MREQWGEWDDLTEEEAEAVRAAWESNDPLVRIRTAMMLHGTAIRQVAAGLVREAQHTTEHCAAIAELEERVKFLEQMLLNDTTQGGGE